MATLTMKDGTRIRYTVRGEGRPPLILIHGWCSNLKHWDPQVRHFARNHRVLRMDRRGHGRSAGDETSLNARQHADDIAAVARRERVRGAVVVGHAGGGAATLEFARAYPQIAKAVVLVDSGLGPRAKVGDPDSPLGAAIGNMIAAMEGPKGQAAFRGIYEAYFNPRADRQMVRQAIAEAMETPIPVAAAELRSIAATDTRAIARQLKQPLLVISANAVDHATLNSVVKNVQVGEVVGSAHFPQLEVPAQVNAMIEQFIGGL